MIIFFHKLIAPPKVINKRSISTSVLVLFCMVETTLFTIMFCPHGLLIKRISNTKKIRIPVKIFSVILKAFLSFGCFLLKFMICLNYWRKMRLQLTTKKAYFKRYSYNLLLKLKSPHLWNKFYTSLEIFITLFFMDRQFIKIKIFYKQQ